MVRLTDLRALAHKVRVEVQKDMYLSTAGGFRHKPSEKGRSSRKHHRHKRRKTKYRRTPSDRKLRCHHCTVKHPKHSRRQRMPTLFDKMIGELAQTIGDINNALNGLVQPLIYEGTVHRTQLLPNTPIVQNMHFVHNIPFAPNVQFAPRVHNHTTMTQSPFSLPNTLTQPQSTTYHESSPQQAMEPQSAQHQGIQPSMQPQSSPQQVSMPMEPQWAQPSMQTQSTMYHQSSPQQVSMPMESQWVQHQGIPPQQVSMPMESQWVQHQGIPPQQVSMPMESQVAQIQQAAIYDAPPESLASLSTQQTQFNQSNYYQNEQTSLCDVPGCVLTHNEFATPWPRNAM